MNINPCRSFLDTFSTRFMHFTLQNNNVSVEVGRSPHVGIPKWKMELTDGWYSISACIDAGMLKGVSTGKIREGTKLVVSGAELLNCDQGCHPLEVGDEFFFFSSKSYERSRSEVSFFFFRF